MRTQKTDWLNDRLARALGMLVSGHRSFAKRLGISSDAVPTLRWIGNRRLGYQPFFVIEASPTGWPDIQAALQASAVAAQIRELFGTEPLTTLFFAPDADAFQISEDGAAFFQLDSDGLRRYFETRQPSWTENPGTTKDANKSRNDAFQAWTGRHLSRFLAVSDIDALDVSRRRFYELKRVVEPVADWLPYLDESSQYSALAFLARQANGVFFTLAYNVLDEGVCAQFRMARVSDDAIDGTRRLLTDYGAVKSDWHAFESRRRRQINRNY